MTEIFVREGVAEDFNELMRLCIDATKENAFVIPDEMMLAEHMYAALTKQMGVAGVIGGGPGEALEGAIVLRIGPVWYSPEPILEEKAIYVSPEFRSAKGGRARKLAEWQRTFQKILVFLWRLGYCRTQGLRRKSAFTNVCSVPPLVFTSCTTPKRA